MIDQPTTHEIRQKGQEFWEKEAASSVFREIAQGKEVGHRIADFVDEQTTALLARCFVTRYQCDTKGRRATRSMGDIWLEREGIFHPINVKAGITGREGQPNMVSLKKVLDALLRCRIDSYYLLMVKLQVAQVITPNVYFVDMLDYLDYVAFDSGPGQIMLKARAFFRAFANGIVPSRRTVGDKVDKLLELLEDGERRLTANRRTSLASFRTRVREYRQRGTEVVTPATQEPLNLQ